VELITFPSFIVVIAIFAPPNRPPGLMAVVVVPALLKKPFVEGLGVDAAFKSPNKLPPPNAEENFVI
jgi:hypothetical protein